MATLLFSFGLVLASVVFHQPVGRFRGLVTSVYTPGFGDPNTEYPSYWQVISNESVPTVVSATTQTAEQPKPHACDECTGRFRSARTLFAHKRTHHTDRDTFCYMCNKPYSTRKSFMDHLRRKHPENAVIEKASHNLSSDPAEVAAIMPYACNACPRRFSDRKSLTKHRKSHTTNDTKCPECHKVFSMRSVLKVHMLSAHQGAPMPEKSRKIPDMGFGHLECKYCGRRYTTQCGLRGHEKLHQSLETYCGECDITLATKQTFARHMLRRHSEGAGPKSSQSSEART